MAQMKHKICVHQRLSASYFLSAIERAVRQLDEAQFLLKCGHDETVGAADFIVAAGLCC
jgi:hypothetical protein